MCECVPAVWSRVRASVWMQAYFLAVRWRVHSLVRACSCFSAWVLLNSLPLLNARSLEVCFIFGLFRRCLLLDGQSLLRSRINFSCDHLRLNFLCAMFPGAIAVFVPFLFRLSHRHHSPHSCLQPSHTCLTRETGNTYLISYSFPYHCKFTEWPRCARQNQDENFWHASGAKGPKQNTYFARAIGHFSWK